MSSMLSAYIRKEAELKKLQEELEAMQNDERYTTELEFRNRLEALLTEYGRNPSDVVEMLTPSTGPHAKNESQTGKAKRRLKLYTNPHTGEKVETRGGNNKTIRAWKDKYGADDVDSWFVFID